HQRGGIETRDEDDATEVERIGDHEREERLLDRVIGEQSCDEQDNTVVDDGEQEPEQHGSAETACTIIDVDGNEECDRGERERERCACREQGDERCRAARARTHGERQRDAGHERECEWYCESEEESGEEL